MCPRSWKLSTAARMAKPGSKAESRSTAGWKAASTSAPHTIRIIRPPMTSTRIGSSSTRRCSTWNAFPTRFKPITSIGDSISADCLAPVIGSPPAGGLVFFGDDDGQLVALDAATGRHLWHYYLGQNLTASPITFMADGKQYVKIAAATDVFTFALFEPQAGGRK